MLKFTKYNLILYHYGKIHEITGSYLHDTVYWELQQRRSGRRDMGYCSAVVRIKLVDTDGNNLLDEETNGNFVGEIMGIGYSEKIDITVTNEYYEAIWDWKDLMPETKAYMPQFYGFTWSGLLGYPDSTDNCLTLGEFDGAVNKVLNCHFLINNINTVWFFEYHHEFTWKKGKPHQENYIMYNREKIEGNTLTIELPEGNSIE